MESLLNPDNFIALLTLTGMEIVLGVDNIIFISILVGKLPPEKRDRIRSLGISLALITRLLLLLSISWIMSLSEPFFSVFEKSFSGRDLILLGGGLFLIAKATFEIHGKLELDELHSPEASSSGKNMTKAAGLILGQIIILDIVFSLDSVITAVGMVSDLTIMTTAMILSMLVMLAASSSISQFVDKHPTIKILALSFLILIGVMLTAEGLGSHMPKGYIYFAMFFSLTVELINMRYRKKLGKE